MKKRLSLLLLLTALAHGAEKVRFERVPEGGVQPQLATSPDGTLHLVYLTGDPRGGDVRHVTKRSGAANWSEPRTLNGMPATAVAAGTIRGAQIAVGKDDSLHVVWNGPGGKNTGREGACGGEAGAGDEGDRDRGEPERGVLVRRRK